MRKFNHDREDSILKVHEELCSILQRHCLITKEMVYDAMEKYGVFSGLSDRGRARKIVFLLFFWVKFFFWSPQKFRKFRPCRTPPARTRGVPPWGGVENYRRGILYHFPALDFEKQKIRKNILDVCPPH